MGVRFNECPVHKYNSVDPIHITRQSTSVETHSTNKDRVCHVQEPVTSACRELWKAKTAMRSTVC